MTTVLDASALLARLQSEPGAELVEQALLDDARCCAVHWSETAQKVIAAGGNWSYARSLLSSYHLKIEPVTAADAEWAAYRWKRQEGLSLADRLCLALAERLDTTVLTADTAWGSGGRILQIR
ncbi:MAG: PIN domain-containing protein [Acidimicrobiaceae bacterium]|nr:PIN domain-containing protein [Acidimicrobiaceae bacterium]MCY4279241.1 PIN domain-containing protein [Acidimicrobiaceae bacterium]MCY4294180.1 PIN domain-containing protein [Acidimicrobiaceae bacterium]